ncbi:MAG: single-stranded-DNA-specific exonuclease RecJ [Thermodesulfovibrionales bacterium]|nr:single-stranded-DNA-specific exonuclease RecJ [Thermodesulfovibrionales bacterium]
MSLDSSNNRWRINKTNSEFVEYISKIASISPILAQILINRGLKNLEQIDYFLNPSLTKLSDPFELSGMKEAIDRIMLARKNKERVLICGDYDADGITATAIMIEGLKRLSIDVDYFIPNRLKDGYGFGNRAIDKATAIGAKLIITVDCGINSFDSVLKAKNRGIDVIITDHHEPFKLQDDRGSIILPDAISIVNPKICNCSHNQANLSGAGVAFKVLQALFGNIDSIYDFLDLTAIGTAADVVPLLGDNRVFVREGLALLQSGNRIGIKMLKAVSGLKTDFFKTSFLNFVIIPRINAAGRVADANEVVKLLITTSEAEAEELSKRLNELNIQRQQMEEIVFNDVKLKIEAFNSLEDAIVLGSESWHPGVIGIVAARIAEMYYRPTFLFNIKGDIAKGSSRSIPPFNIYKGLEECKDLLLNFGGHKQAAGLTIEVANLERFKQRIGWVVSKTLTNEDLIPTVNIDVAVNLKDIDLATVYELSSLEPLGYGNEEPLFGAKRLEVINPRIVGNNHLKLYLKQNGKSLDSIGFALGHLLDVVGSNTIIDAVFCPTLNEWDGGKYLQLNLKAIRIAKDENNS